MFKSLTVAKRLAFGFGFIVSIGVAIVVFGASTMRNLSGDISELATDRMVVVAQLTELRDNFQTIGRLASNTVINNDPTLVAAERQKIAPLHARNTELLSQLDKTITAPDARKLFSAIIEKRGPYNAALDRVIEMSVKGDTAGAGDYLIGEVNLQQDVVFKATEESIRLQQASATTLAQHALRSVSLGVAVMFGLALLMGAVGTAVAWMIIRSLRTKIQMAVTVVDEVAAGDLTQDISRRGQDEIDRLLQAMARMQTQLASVVSSVRANSESVAAASAEIAQGNQDLSHRTDEQSSVLQQTAILMEQMGATVRNNAGSAQQANQLAQDASAVASQGGQVVGEVVATMQGISSSSRKIGDIIGVIDGIAFQTNILALNAAVEAARAGEQGRGFAVVASEVRGLAQRSASAAKEIKTLIGHSVEQVERGTVLVDQAGRTMGEILGSIQRVSEIVAEIASASVEQNVGISRMVAAVSQIDQTTQQNAAMVEQSAAAAESLKNQSEQLVQAVAVFTLASDGRT